MITVILALVSVGFAHKTAPSDRSPELAAYLALGGSLSDLCGLPVGEGQAVLVDCEACRIADNLISLRGCDSAVMAELEQTRTFAFVAKRLAQSRGLDPARLTRAPPHA